MSLVYVLAYNAFVVTAAALSCAELRRMRCSTRDHLVELTRTLNPTGISVIVPAYNEENVICETVTSILGVDYPEVEVIVVSDGSTDGTVDVLVDRFGLRESRVLIPGPIETQPVKAVFRSTAPNLVVVDKERSGAKADGSNCGLNMAQHEWVAIMDADELLDPEVLLRCMTEAAHRPDNVVAVGTTLLPSNDARVTNGRVHHAIVPRRYWTGCQLVEYLNGFLLFRPGMSRIGGMTNISGGFGLFRRDVLLAIGGYRNGHLGEDMDLTARVHRYMRGSRQRYAFAQVPEAVVWTQLPASRGVLRKQRVRWHRGLVQVLRDGRGTVGRPRFGTYGMVGMPFQYLFEWFGAPSELAGWVLVVVGGAFGIMPWPVVLAVLAASQGTAAAISISSAWAAIHYLGHYRSREDRFRLLLWGILVQLGYHQVILLWRVRALFGRPPGWGEMPRETYRATPVTSL